MDANVFLEIKGKHTTGKHKLDSMWNNFESGKTDTFNIDSIDVGTIRLIIVGHDNSGTAKPWFVESITITNLSTKKVTKFPVRVGFPKTKTTV